MYDNRSKIILFVVLGIGFLFFLRLMYVQVVDTEYKQFAEDNALRKQIIIPPRGLIFDRKGKLIVNNETIYDVMVIPGKVREDFDTSAFCKLLDVDKAIFIEDFKKAKEYSNYRGSAIIRQISREDYGRLQERLFDYKGFYVESRTARTYPNAAGAHILGYLGEVNDKDIKDAEDAYYRIGDYQGKSGLEKKYENELRGVKGFKNILVDVLNREQGRYLNGKLDVPASPGNSLLTGIDLALQEYGEKLMKGKKGSIIAIEPSTGEILCMVTSPTYDPNLLLGRKRGSNIAKLLVDPEKPMFNRSIQARYPPGSTMKPVFALMSLNDHVIHPSTTFSCNGGYHLTASQTIHCHADGTFDLEGAIRMSCNTYFCNVFKLQMDQRKFRRSSEGLKNWDDYLYRFGMGNKLGIDLPNENRGLIPTHKIYDKAYGKNRWNSSTIISLGIGQAEISLTPLQLANNAATIANKGYYITPHFVKDFEFGEKKTPVKWEKHSTGIDSSYFGLVKDAMEDVMTHGTGVFGKVKDVPTCGKTGTAQNPHGKDHSIFIGFAPKDNPKIAIAIVIENAGFGGSYACPMAGLIMEKYLKDSVSNKGMEEWLIGVDLMSSGKDPLADANHQTKKKKERTDSKAVIESTGVDPPKETEYKPETNKDKKLE